MSTIKTVVKVPCRIDLAGGTLDLWPLYLYFGGLELVNMAINVQARTEIEFTPGPSLEVHVESADLKTHNSYASLQALSDSLKQDTKANPLRWVNRMTHHWLATHQAQATGIWKIKTSSDAPPGSGLGGSSVLGISMQLAFLETLDATKAKSLTASDRWTLQQRTRDLEAIEIEHPAGDQDYVPALFRGLIAMHMSESERRVEHLPAESAQWVSDHVALLYTGKPHHSGLNNWQIFKSLHEGDRSVREALQSICDISKELAGCLRAKDFSRVSQLINREWEQRQRLSATICPPVLNEAWSYAESLGANARKACGSGGGGCMLFAFADKTKKVRQSQKRYRTLIGNGSQPKL